MAALRVTQFYEGIPSGTSPVTVYTVPSGKRAVLSGLTGKNLSTTGSITPYVYINGNIFYSTALVHRDGPGDSFYQSCYVVLNEGDYLGVRSPIDGQVYFTLSGKTYFV